MVIEWLKVNVPSELRETYIQTDEAIWTATLATYPGYVGKEVWLNPHNDRELVMVIYWQSKADWKAIPQAVLDQTEQRFSEALGQSFPLVEEGEYQVRRFGGRS